MDIHSWVLYLVPYKVLIILLFLLSFPSIRSDDYKSKRKSVLELLAVLKNTVTEFTWSLLKSNVLEDHVSSIRSAKEGVEFRPVSNLSISTVTFSLDEIKQIKAKLGGTVNDIIVGIIFYAIRLYMEATTEGSGNVNGVTISAFFNLDTTNPLEFVFEAQKTITNKKNSLVAHLTGIFIESMRRLRGPEVPITIILQLKILHALNIIYGPVQKVSFANNPIRGFYYTTVNMRITVAAEKELINPKLFNDCTENAFQKILQAAMSTTSSKSNK
ncbi:hypothetical protein MKW94_011835 [Papaver nudicaule]|uniref:O-acyltransferase WSD1 C-terminal domain-containing protein n=1 Tax=Papaver nudicaule TaxID=74823 RepID=A0AA41SGA2_PAPNU|nr:hypothetical protein [Papaver nudicaule]